MKVLDTNILVSAHRQEMPFHDQALAVIKRLCEGSQSWAITWPSIHEFLAVVTNPRIFNLPTPMQIAWKFLDALEESPSLRLLSETDEHAAILRKMLQESRVVGPRVHDARIAALCLEHGTEVLLTADRDFSRFAGLKVENPLLDARAV